MSDFPVRLNTNLSVLLTYPPIGLIKARITSLCHSSLCLDTDPIRLKAGYHVQVLIQNGLAELRDRDAIVMSTTNKGSYLFFDRPLSEQELWQLRRSQKRAA